MKGPVWKMGKREGDYILAAFAESHAGPGWANSPLHVIIGNRDGSLREVYIQPEELGREMHALYCVSQAAHLSMTAYVRSEWEKP